ncbi:hypothetical protein, partial [Martelella mediterranea]|uniref:hypothetical protein n=1 Tax=Martelella mediterranea TaxID=293089 RepID=UPI000527BC14
FHPMLGRSAVAAAAGKPTARSCITTIAQIRQTMLGLDPSIQAVKSLNLQRSITKPLPGGLDPRVKPEDDPE